MFRKSILPFVLTALLAITMFVSCEEKQYYTVTFDSNGGEGAVEVQNVPEKTPTALKANAFTRTDYSFSGWNTKADGSGTAYADKGKITLTADIILFAQWTRNTATITFDKNGGTGTMEPQVVDTNTKTTLNANAFTWAGHTFVGWNTKPDGSGTGQADRTQISISEDTVLYAWWAEDLTIVFHANDGTPIMTMQEVAPMSTPTLDSNPFTREGFGFYCWNTKADGSGLPYNDQDQVYVSENMDLYAQWVDLHITASTTNLIGGYTYFVNENETVTVSDRMTVSGTDTVTIKVKNNGTLEATKGITVPEASTLILEGGDKYNSFVWASNQDVQISGAAGIGGLNEGDSCGKVVFTGMLTVHAYGGAGAAGIGGAKGGNGGYVEIKGSVDYSSPAFIDCHGGMNAPGIGGGQGGQASEIDFTGGQAWGYAGEGFQQGIAVQEVGESCSLNLADGSQVWLRTDGSEEWEKINKDYYYANIRTDKQMVLYKVNSPDPGAQPSV